VPVACGRLWSLVPVPVPVPVVYVACACVLCLFYLCLSFNWQRHAITAWLLLNNL